MAIYNNLQTIRRLTNSSLTSLIDVTNLNFKSLSDANLEFLDNISYDEITNSFSLYSGTFALAEITNQLTISQSSIPTFTITSAGNAVGKSLLVDVAETQRQRFTDLQENNCTLHPRSAYYTESLKKHLKTHLHPTCTLTCTLTIICTLKTKNPPNHRLGGSTIQLTSL